ncbi:hypothetical protein Pla22_47610 [Rubripirellula amarantea]|uniref:3-keto-disaccharide hydrolase domain-containing protein n=1 Tax=Rubripirellula amarantea TaxID=2527999 RepID=A0A5C5WFM9_9BACT|nr:hypothetical protein [Rubripirellula amarantea]TWT49564.1 hypothetical protein Pla22_47610 [Rubripirellula amarantea]
MKQIAYAALILVLTVALPSVEAGDFNTVIYEDEFTGSVLNKRWGSWKSESEVRDGVLVGITPQDADHPSVNTIEFDPQADIQISVSFQFHGSPSFSVMVRDLDYKGSHAGHICHVAIHPHSVTLYDGKGGFFRKDIRDKRKAGQELDAATKAMLKNVTSRNPIKLDPEAWHDLVIRIEGDVMQVLIDGKEAGRLQSEGIAHSTKSNMNITTADREVHYDHFSLRGR